MPSPYIWQRSDWPAFRFDVDAVAAALALARQQQGRILGMLDAVGLSDQSSVEEAVWTSEALATAAIEGERLDLVAVRSSVLRRLGLEGTSARIDRNADGLLDLMQDAARLFRQPLDRDRLERWQSALFPGGASGVRSIAVGRYRSSKDPMQIVSGPAGREKVHYEAPDCGDVPRQMDRLLSWWEETRPGGRAALDGLVRAAIAHLWFETIHPFEDGNGRVGRALIDLALAQDIQDARRYVSVSRQLMSARNEYYEALNAASRGSMDVTPWMLFFIEQFRRACLASQHVVEAAIAKGHYWAQHAHHAISDRQRKVLRRVIDAGDGGFEGGLSADKYGHLAGASKATATRDLQELLKLGYLRVTGEGRSTRYWVNIPGWSIGDEKVART